VREKGIDRFIDTIALLRRHGLPIRPVIVGEGPDRDRLRSALPDAVFTGHLTGPALASAVASCDILLNPSLTETFGNVTLEAMASGLAVVAADVASSRNLITPDIDGLLATDRSQDYAAQAHRVIVDPGLRASLGQAARATALAHRWDAVLDSVLSGYAALLDRRAGATA
jgi:glycosyltransferase involved in cell wall biosynthesis